MLHSNGLSDNEIRNKYSEETEDLKRKIRNLETLLTDYKKSHGSIANFFQSIKDNIPVYSQGKIVYKLETKKSKPLCGACFQITDTHYGAVQAKSEIEGFGEYSPEICEARCMKFVNDSMTWVNAQRNAYTIKTAHVLVTGDLCSGDIHLELQVTNAFPVPVQVLGSARILSGQLSEISRHFEKMEVHFITEDNHGRLTRKPQAKEAGINSYNYLIGEIAKLHLKNHKNINFNIYPQYEAIITVEGRNYLIMHGHNILGWAGVPFYGLERKVAKEAIKRLNMPGKRFHKVIMGHWHTPFTSTRYWVSGSVQGTDAYDHKNGRDADPSQPAWLVGKHGDFGRVDFVL